MGYEAVMAMVEQQVARICADKGIEPVSLTSETPLLGGALEFDSLDLAGLVVTLQEATSQDPFAAGFIEFRTAGELAKLFSE